MADAIPSTVDAAPYLKAFLTAQRWFRSSDHDAIELHFTGIAPLAPRVHLALVQGEVGEASHRRVIYQLPLVVCPNGAVPPQAVIMPQPGGQVLADALHHPEGRQQLGAALVGGGAWSADGGAWQSSPQAAATAFAPVESRVQTGEQSNSCVIFGKSALLKIYRRLEAGINPDAEMVRFLTDRGFAHVPPLMGLLRYVGRGDARFDAAMLQGFVDGATDGWSHLLQSLRAWLTDPAQPIAALADARTLGGVTRAMHNALAGDGTPAFAPEPVEAARLEQWLQEVSDGVGQTWHYLAEGQLRLPAPVRIEAIRLLSQRPHVERLLSSIRGGLRGGAGQALRHHGDYHLGQTLRVADGSYKVLDFEGEPLRSLAARRERHSPLRDVAGMLRSFSYAAAAASQGDAGAREPAARWEAAMVGGFLETYLQAPLPAYLPPATGIRPLLRLFVLEKALYELRYEVNHRPDWAAIPLRALQQLLGEGAA